MLEGMDLDLRNIFVGREAEIQNLRDKLKLALKDEEHLVYVILNAPGVGKTTLINHFGKLIQQEVKGLYFRLICTSNKNTPKKVNQLIIKQLEKAVHKKREFIIEFIQNADQGEKEWLEHKYDEFQVMLKKKKEKSTLDINDPIDLMVSLSEVIPIIIASDEVQEFQKISFIGPEGTEETALHYFTRILKDLINDRALLILSGTRYHILSQIGNKIGSPIRQKAFPLVISNFSREEVNQYVLEVKRLIKDQVPRIEDDTLSVLISHLSRFFIAFCGGHPRTIDIMTKFFLSHLELFLDHPEYQEYSKMMEFLLEQSEDYFSDTLLSSDHKDALKALSSSQAFSSIKSWILNNGTQGLALNTRPKVAESELDAEIKRITYELMNIGIIVQNGQNNYYLTSYFHFLEFLKIYHDPREEFLKQVLFNKHFKLMCGSHSGFGYTFENVLSAALLITGDKTDIDAKIPMTISRIKDSRIIKGKINWEELSLKEDMLYQTPQARAVDALILQQETLILMQFTTATTPDPSKIDELITEMEIIDRWPVRGWLVSLFPIKAPLNIPETLRITSGEDLNTVLGEELANRLRDIKESL